MGKPEISFGKDIKKEDLTITEYYLKNIKTALHNNKSYTVKQRIVDRSFYQDELREIWKTQSKFYCKEFTDKVAIYEIAERFTPTTRKRTKS